MRMHLIGRQARPVVCRVHKGDLVCDMRTLVDARDEDDLVEALVELVAWVLGDGGATACQGGGR